MYSLNEWNVDSLCDTLIEKTLDFNALNDQCVASVSQGCHNFIHLDFTTSESIFFFFFFLMEVIVWLIACQKFEFFFSNTVWLLKTIENLIIKNSIRHQCVRSINYCLALICLSWNAITISFDVFTQKCLTYVTKNNMTSSRIYAFF